MRNELDSEIEFGRKYASSAEDIWNWTSHAGQVRAVKRANRIIYHGKISNRDKVLELGCGTGLFTKFIYDKTACKLLAIDISQELLNIAVNRIPFGVDFKLYDANNFDFGLEQFSVVFGSSILHHLNIEQVLVNIYKVLEKDGRIIFVEPNLFNPQIYCQKNIPYIKKCMGDLEHETAINRFKLTKLMQSIGFSNIVTIPYDFLHPKTPKVLIKFTNSLGYMLENIPIVREIAGSVIIYGEK